MGERVINFPWGYFVTLYKIMCKGSWKYLHTFYAQQWNSHINKLRPTLEILFGTRKFHYDFFCVIDNSYGKNLCVVQYLASHIMLWNNSSFNNLSWVSIWLTFSEFLIKRGNGRYSYKASQYSWCCSYVARHWSHWSS